MPAQKYHPLRLTLANLTPTTTETVDNFIHYDAPNGLLMEATSTPARVGSGTLSLLCSYDDGNAIRLNPVHPQIPVSATDFVTVEPPYTLCHL